MNTLLGSLILAGVASGVPVSAADGHWIHVRVDDAGGAGERVDIQVPVEMVSSLLPALKGAGGHGTIQINADSVDLDELRGYWNAVRASKDGDYIRVRDADTDVRVAKRDGYFRLTVDEKGGKNRVRMQVPLPLVDAVLTGKGEIDFEALSGALAKAPEGDLLTVDDEDSHVRIWIDGKPAPTREDAP